MPETECMQMSNVGRGGGFIGSSEVKTESKRNICKYQLNMLNTVLTSVVNIVIRDFSYSNPRFYIVPAGHKIKTEIRVGEENSVRL